MLLSIIIPTYKRLRALCLCLDALQQQVQADADCTVYIMDDESSALVAETIAKKYPWANYHTGPGKGAAANRNRGAQYSQSEWLIFLDDDCVPGADCIYAYRQAIKEQPQICVFEGAILPQAPRNSLNESAPLNRTGGRLWSCNFCIKRCVFDQLNGFDEQFTAFYEDIDFNYRLKANQIDIVFVPCACVYHPWHIRGGWKRFWTQRPASMLYLNKHPTEWKHMSGWITLKITIGRFLKETLPGLWVYRGRGFLACLVFDSLDLLFSLYLFYYGFKKNLH